MSFSPDAVVLASFGTTHADTRERCIDALAAEMRAAFPQALIVQAFTSSMVRAVWAKRGQEVNDVPQALDGLAAQGARRVLVQPAHLLRGHEFEKMCEQAESKRGQFEELRFGTPLLSSTDDVQTLMALLGGLYPKQANQAVVFMGHGTDHEANEVYGALNAYARSQDREDLFVATVEGTPTLDDALTHLASRSCTDVRLIPLMLVAGDHAVNDMAGCEPESWSSQLAGAGYEVTCELRGLGEIAQVRSLYVRHAQAACL